MRRAFIAGAEWASAFVGFLWTLDAAEALEHRVRARHWPRFRHRFTLYGSYRYCDRCDERKKKDKPPAEKAEALA